MVSCITRRSLTLNFNISRSANAYKGILGCSVLATQNKSINAIAATSLHYPIYRNFSSSNNTNDSGKTKCFDVKTATSSPNFNYGYPTPGPQSPTPQKVMNHQFFVSETEWKRVREEMHFDYVVIGTSFGALGFAERILANNPHSRILMLERGPFFLPEHFQNLPVPYQKTLGGLSETFPWTVSEKTWNGKHIKWLHGSVPFFGGRSIMWSSWCPRPLESEMTNWPKQVISTLSKYFKGAESLLNVIPANEIDKNAKGSNQVFGVLQESLTKMIQDNLKKISSATRVMAAPLAVGPKPEKDIDFIKFSTPGPLLKLIDRQANLAAEGKGAPIKVATECIVERVLEQNGKATALETSRGVVALGNAKLILAMGCLPATTLVLNSFPQAKNAGKHFTAHFISSVIARVPRKDYSFSANLSDLELAAIYLAGADKKKGQYHIQLTAISDSDPESSGETAARHMPDVVATATPEQLRQSKDYIVYVCAVLGEINVNNPNNWFRLNNTSDKTTNSTLQVIESESDKLTWETMDEGTFQTVEKVLSPQGITNVEYWHPDVSGNGGSWKKGERPTRDQIRVPGLVHEGSTMHLGDANDANAVVDLDYRLKGVNNVYLTGTSLWPQSGSWNPTMTLVALSQHLADKLSKQGS